jgi:hypothetical protein
MVSNILVAPSILAVRSSLTTSVTVISAGLSSVSFSGLGGGGVFFLRLLAMVTNIGQAPVQEPWQVLMCKTGRGYLSFPPPGLSYRSVAPTGQLNGNPDR